MTLKSLTREQDLEKLQKHLSPPRKKKKKKKQYEKKSGGWCTCSHVHTEESLWKLVQEHEVRQKKVIFGYIRACFGSNRNGISLPDQHTKYRLKSAAYYLNVHLIRLVLLSFISPVSQQRWSG